MTRCEEELLGDGDADAWLAVPETGLPKAEVEKKAAEVRSLREDSARATANAKRLRKELEEDKARRAETFGAQKAEREEKAAAAAAASAAYRDTSTSQLSIRTESGALRHTFPAETTLAEVRMGGMRKGTMHSRPRWADSCHESMRHAEGSVEGWPNS